MTSSSASRTRGSTLPHDEYACYGSPRHCSGCGEDEDLEPCYLRCFECGHIFPTAEDLLANHNQVIAEMNKYYHWEPPMAYDTDVDRVFCCPVCIHDF